MYRLQENLTRNKSCNVLLWADRAAMHYGWSVRGELAFCPQIEVQDPMERVGRSGEDIGDYLVQMSDANASLTAEAERRRDKHP